MKKQTRAQITAETMRQALEISKGGIHLHDMCYATRHKMRLSQREFAMLVGTTQTEVSLVEHGFIPLSTTKVKNIAKMYNRMFDRGVEKHYESKGKRARRTV